MTEEELAEESVFPACAGVIRWRRSHEYIIRGFPRMCGGDPLDGAEIKKKEQFSPHVRG